MNAVHKPSDCLLLVAFSLTEIEFTNDLREQTNKDYAKGVRLKYRLLPHALWRLHHAHLAQTILSIAAQVQQYGVTVRLQTRLDDLRNLSSFKVVTVLAHFNNKMKSIELSDQLHSMSGFADAADSRFIGLFDLSVCNSVYLQDCLKSKFGDQCFVRANEEVAEIRFHLILYKNIIERLHQGDKNYLNEMINLRVQLAHLLQHKNTNNGSIQFNSRQLRKTLLFCRR